RRISRISGVTGALSASSRWSLELNPTAKNLGGLAIGASSSTSRSGVPGRSSDCLCSRCHSSGPASRIATMSRGSSISTTRSLTTTPIASRRADVYLQIRIVRPFWSCGGGHGCAHSECYFDRGGHRLLGVRDPGRGPEGDVAVRSDEQGFRRLVVSSQLAPG